MLFNMSTSGPHSTELAPFKPAEVEALIVRALESVREEVRDSPYIEEAIRVLPVRGYRSAIGCFWNAVVDDLRNKIIHRSLSLFNKVMKDQVGRQIKTYEDFQNHVKDEHLLDGAYEIGVIGWEAHKILKHAKDTRNIFDGHPRSSEPSLVKVLSMMDDCRKYVLNVEYPPQIIDLDEYVATLDTETFDRNDVAIETAVGSLPEIYTKELAHRLFTAYTDAGATTVLRGNIEYVVPILWPLLPRPLKLEVARRVDQVIAKGNTITTTQSFRFLQLAKSIGQLSLSARRYHIGPLVKTLKESLDDWSTENSCVRALKPYAAQVPPDLLLDYVRALTQTYVGNTGRSPHYARTDFYANGAALDIPEMFEFFDDRAAEAFIRCIRKNETLKRRIQNPTKLDRLRSLGNIVDGRVSKNFAEKAVLKALVTPDKEKDFFKLIA